MTEALYRERAEGPIPRTHGALPRKTKEGLVAQVKIAFDNDMLAEKFPKHCPDGNSVCGTATEEAIRTIEAHIPDFDWPPERDIDDGTLFDLIEFFATRVAVPQKLNHHPYFNHYELEFSGQEGRKNFQEDIDSILKNGGTLFTLTPSGRIERIGTSELQDALSTPLPCTEDTDFDSLIVEARDLYKSPDRRKRQTGLEKLWDAFERIKTIEGEDDVKTSVNSLLRHIASEPFRERIDHEMKQLTEIGNSFRIRHHKRSTHEIPSPEAADYLFARMSSLIMYLLKTSGRTGEAPQSADSAHPDGIVF